VSSTTSRGSARPQIIELPGLRQQRRQRAGAFFDVDRTVLRGSSFLALARPMRRGGLITRRRLLAAALHQMWFTLRGTSHQRLEAAAQAGAHAVAGMHAEGLRELVAESLYGVLLPRVYQGAWEALRAHHGAEEPVFLVSSAPVEIVEQLARALGAADYAATEAEVVDGRYTGELCSFCYGPEKYHAVHDLAARHGIDLAGSTAYADSFADAPMLGAVGHPVCVNPDRDLRALAVRRGWEVRRFDATGRPRG
jgi:HAD superfamily hydrolase (TIGR01490 family)